MNFKTPILAGAIGTSFMTLFSYATSHAKKKQFREPVLLARLMAGRKEHERKEDLVKEWLAHYLVGFVFALSYQQFLKGKIIREPLLKGMMAGAMYGAIGVVGWRAAFKIHPAPPKINYTEYYRHLIAAHIIFGAFAFGILEKEKNE